MKTSYLRAAVLAVLCLEPGLCAAQPAPAAAPTSPPAAGTALPLTENGELAVLIQAGQETVLSSQMAGRIGSLKVGLGETVRAGEQLLQFDCSEQRAQLQSAEAEYRGARDTHLTRLRLQALGAAGELDVTLAAAAADKLRGQVDVRASQLAYCSVHAPFSGKVARLRVKLAESVPLGAPLVDLVDTGAPKAQIFVPVALATTLRPGMQFDVKIRETGRTYRARISKLNSRVDGVSQQLEIEARFEGNPSGLIPGMVGAAVLGKPQRPASRK